MEFNVEINNTSSRQPQLLHFEARESKGTSKEEEPFLPAAIHSWKDCYLPIWIEAITAVEQAGFFSNGSCTDRGLSLTTQIEVGFEKRLKTFPTFIDLTAAYDTV